MGLPRLLEQLFSRETAGLLFGDQAEVGELVERLLSSVRWIPRKNCFPSLRGSSFPRPNFRSFF